MSEPPGIARGNSLSMGPPPQAPNSHLGPFPYPKSLEARIGRPILIKVANWPSVANGLLHAELIFECIAQDMGNDALDHIDQVIKERAARTIGTGTSFHSYLSGDTGPLFLSC